MATVGDEAREEFDIGHPVAYGAEMPIGTSTTELDDPTIETHEAIEPGWDGDREAQPSTRFLGHGPGTLVHEGRPGVLVAVDLVRLCLIATQSDTEIHFCVPIGRFVPVHAAVLQVRDGSIGEAGESLRSALAWASEPTLASDPRHAFRVLVDIGPKGLAPGVNDPTTAVQAIDQMHDLLRRLAWRRLGELRVRDAAGAVRVTLPAPTWGHYLRLVREELADFGARHAQVRRYLRAMLDDLGTGVPEPRRAATLLQREHTERALAGQARELNRTVESDRRAVRSAGTTRCRTAATRWYAGEAMRPGLHLSRVCAAVAVLAALGLTVVEAPHVALLLGPAFLLFLILVVGLFPGEEAIARARARRSGARRPRAPEVVASPALPSVVRPAGIALAFALAMRPPPAVLVTR